MIRLTVISVLLGLSTPAKPADWEGVWAQADFSGTYPTYNYDDETKPCALSWFEKRTLRLEKAQSGEYDYVGVFVTDRMAVWRGVNLSPSCKFYVDGELAYVRVPSYLRTWNLYAKEVGQDRIQIHAEFKRRSGTLGTQAADPNDARSWDSTFVRRGNKLHEIDPPAGKPFVFESGEQVALSQDVEHLVRKTLEDLSGGRCLSALQSALHPKSYISSHRSEYCELLRQRRLLSGDLISIRFDDYTAATDWMLMGPNSAGTRPIEEAMGITPSRMALLPYTITYEQTRLPGEAVVVLEDDEWKIIGID